MTRSARWLALLALLAAVGCRQTGSTPANVAAGTGPRAGATSAPENPKEVTVPSGLKYEDLVVGNGALAEDGMTATVHYTGRLVDGTKFDSSLDRGQPFSFQIGAGQVIRGWDEGVRGMRAGGKRKLTIPPDLGYGDRGVRNLIPPGATLIFEVELLGVK